MMRLRFLSFSNAQARFRNCFPGAALLLILQPAARTTCSPISISTCAAFQLKLHRAKERQQASSHPRKSKGEAQGEQKERIGAPRESEGACGQAG